ncbi:hypothetical protein F2P44_22800 [Massilia sp. CCM 8695]|uniref:Uncharacterized protein n=1 Tax=Massilia frigida TaxID=2609281 RepID=A0ABX0NGH1_9BURK|nr:hypothetical protein [Massilia frigida]
MRAASGRALHRDQVPAAAGGGRTGGAGAPRPGAGGGPGAPRGVPERAGRLRQDHLAAQAGARARRRRLRHLLGEPGCAG